MYDGSTENGENDVIVFYRPVYICVKQSEDGASSDAVSPDTYHKDASSEATHLKAASKDESVASTSQTVARVA